MKLFQHPCCQGMQHTSSNLQLLLSHPSCVLYKGAQHFGVGQNHLGTFVCKMKHVVTLGDASLTTDDLALLVPPAWMNDQLISFWCEHLRINILENHPQVAIIPPNVTYLIALTNGKTCALCVNIYPVSKQA